MEDCLSLLIVEDDERQVKYWETDIDLFNRKESKNESPIIKHKIKRNLKDGLDAISSGSFDAAVVDLKLSAISEKPEGNKIIAEIKKKQRFPIFVVSGFIEDLEELEETDERENPFFKVYSRDEKLFKDILNEIVSIYNTGITKLLGKGGGSLISVIESSLQEIFWKHMSLSFDEILQSTPDKEKVLLRYSLTHLIEYLSSDEVVSDETYYPGEMYVLPPIKDNLTAGVLLKEKKSGDFFIILTPLCDMVIRKNGSRKAKKIMLVQIECIKYNPQIKEINKMKKSKQEDNLKDLLKNNFSLNYHFLPPAKKFKGGFINFQYVSSIEEKQIRDKFNIIGKVTAPFLKDIISRFSTYYARQGQPALDLKPCIDKILDNQTGLS
jgi:hypothetical protein